MGYYAPHKLDTDGKQVYELHEQGKTYAEIAKLLNFSQTKAAGLGLAYKNRLAQKPKDKS